MYYPKNQIQTGFYSNGDLAELRTKQPYTGPYFNTSDGKSFSGKEPNDGPNIELIPLPNPTTKREPTPTFKEGREWLNEDPRFFPWNAPYSYQTGVPRNTPVYSPVSYYPILTESNIQNGSFTRYFVKKVNQNLYTEVNTNNYANSINSDLYIGIELPWVISGDKEEVRQINAKQVDFVEKSLEITGLGKFLRYNYLQFYQG